MSVIGSNILAGASGQAGYNLTKSLRFRSSASAYLDRTPASASNRKTWTWSGWVKRGQLGIFYPFLQANYSGVPWFVVGFANNDKIEITQNAGSSASWETPAVFRDCSAWYHIVCVVDTTSATSTMNGSATDRFRLYVNGTQYVISGGSVPSQNADLQVNNTVAHTVGGYVSHYGDGYLAEVNFIDGQALTPSSFGETSTTTGVWIPKKYTGTYGTNGFYLPFTDTTSTSTLGTDFSGNSNTWTTNNISLTTGSTYDSMTDVPTNTSATTANYCVMNPLDNGGLTVTGGNLNLSLATATWYSIRASMAFPSTGKYYWEYTVNDSGNHIVGILDANGSLGANTYIYGSNQYGYGWQSAAALKGNNGTTSAYGSAATTNDVIMIAFDADNRSLFVGKNGTWFNSSNPTTNTSPMYSSIPTTLTFFPTFAQYSTVSSATTFGQRPFAYTPPTGFVALNTFNLPTPTIGATASSQANEYFDVTTYTGNGTAGRVITMSNMTNVGFAWVKIRSGADDHRLANTVTGGNKHLKSNATDAESTSTNMIQAFSSNTFTIGSDTGVNANSSTYVGWVWANDGTSGSTNTAGSITSTVSANTTAGFSIVTYTGTGANATVGHGLGVAPSMVIVKARSTTGNWCIWHTKLTSGAYALFFNTDAQDNYPTIWNSTIPTSTVFSIGTASGTNVNGQTQVAYCFAQIAGYSAFGSYTGNGSTDGPFVYTGFRPRFVLVKESSAAGNNWVIYDTARDAYNECSKILYPNASNAEFDGSTVNLDILSNGFKPRDNWGGNNNSGNTYIYMAFAENPFKYANAR